MATCGPNGATHLYVIDDTSLSADDVLALTHIVGVTARKCPQLYRTSSDSYGEWLSRLQSNYSVATTNISTLADALTLFAPSLQGYVLATVGDISVAVAYTVAAAMDVIAVTVNNEAVAQAAGLSMLYDVRNETLLWALDTFNNSGKGFVFNPRIAALQDPSKNGFVGDYTAFARGVFWWDTDMTSPLSTRVLGSLAGPAAIFGWGVSEDQTVAAATTNGAYVHASDWAKNMAVLSNYRNPARREQAPGMLPAPAAAPAHTVTFVMTDGDNIQWLLSGMTSNPLWWGSPDRGQVPLGWTLSPALSDLAVVVMDLMYEQAVPGMDYFVGAPSGIGYTYPDMMTSDVLSNFSTLTAQYMSAAGMKYVNVLGEDYESAAVQAMTATPGIDGIIWYDYSSYSGLNGNVTFVNGKPVVGGRFQLWTGVFESPSSLVAKLLQQPADPSSAAGYSLIPVHVWSNNVTEVRWVAEQLAAHGGFNVVTPDVYMQLITANIAH